MNMVWDAFKRGAANTHKDMLEPTLFIIRGIRRATASLLATFRSK